MSSEYVKLKIMEKYNTLLKLLNKILENMGKNQIEDGQEYFNSLLKIHNNGEQLNTIMVKSPNDGIHIYFMYDEEINKCTTKINKYSMDIRSDGG